MCCGSIWRLKLEFRVLNLLQTCYTPEREKEEGESTLGAPASPPSRAREPRGSCQPLHYEHSCQPIHYLQSLPYDFGCQPSHHHIHIPQAASADCRSPPSSVLRASCAASLICRRQRRKTTFTTRAEEGSSVSRSPWGRGGNTSGESSYERWYGHRFYCPALYLCIGS